MDNDHGITGELRTGGIYRPASNGRYFTEEELTAIADRIDAEHERTMAAAALIAGVPMTDENMAEHGWVKLPVDADGEYIHVGDMMENGERVARIVLTDGSWDPSVYTAKTPNQLREYFCREISHYHKPTVEDVLRGVVTLCHNTWKEESPFHFCDVDDVMKSGNIADFAAKLRLAGDAE